MASILPKEEKMTSAAVVQTRRPRRKTFYHVETPAFGFLGIFLAVCLLIFLITVLGKPVEGYIDKLTTENHRICYTTVNVREEPDISAKIVDEYTLGSYVYFTGRTISYPLHDGTSHLWFELTDGNWISSDAVMNEAEFNFRFGH